MSPLDSFFLWALGISAVAIVCGVCAQGRLKHWILVLLGEVPREASPGPFGEIPRRERDWSMLSTLVDIEPAAEAGVPVDGPDQQDDDDGVTTSGRARPDASES